RFALQLLLLADLEGFLELAQRVGGQAHALEALAQMRACLERLLLGAEDLLVDRDGLRVEAAAREHLGDLGVGLDRLLLVALLEEQVADLQADVRIARVRLEQLVVLGERLVVRALLRVFLRGLERLALLGREGQGWVLARLAKTSKSRGVLATGAYRRIG